MEASCVCPFVIDGEEQQQLKCSAFGCPFVFDGEELQQLKCPTVGCPIVMNGEDDSIRFG